MRHTFALLSAARLAYIWGWRATLDMLAALGKVFRWEERLGKETRLVGTVEAIINDGAGFVKVYRANGMGSATSMLTLPGYSLTSHSLPYQSLPALSGRILPYQV